MLVMFLIAGDPTILKEVAGKFFRTVDIFNVFWWGFAFRSTLQGSQENFFQTVIFMACSLYRIFDKFPIMYVAKSSS